ncbi:hypothetical protein STCU_09536 [Strigomonas culicis]|uniref:Uncharacterized protein n=1 Tax=Strigomonas culicis TaxID=28005 RepID=S9V8L3_9TRYP|nr:hypothetical protein STCU_09536 [Strigomonas culicis]|eukprot:EPY19295.1 hypothetical protein STCU_09536 [Strigomonas culicis]
MDDNMYLTNIVSENESLRMQIEDLNEKLESTGLSQLYQLREENEHLTIEVSQLHVQLEERNHQIEILCQSNNRFENINVSLQELLQQVASQRAELADLKFVLQEKEAAIVALQAQAAAAAQQQQQHDATAAQLTAELQERDAQLAAAREAAAHHEAQHREKEQALLQLREEAAEQSRLRCEREHATGAAAAADEVAAHEAALADALAREVAAEKARMEAQAALQQRTQACEALRQRCAATLAEVEQLRARLQQAEAAKAATPAADAIQMLFATNSEAKALLRQHVHEACAERDARLLQQVNENAALLSRMALLQAESEHLVKKLKAAQHTAAAEDYSKATFTSGAPVAVAGAEPHGTLDCVDYKSKMAGKRTTMEKRVADFLFPLTTTSGAATADAPAGVTMINMRDLELLLQELLNYQEDTENESSTRLLIKDMEMEDQLAKLFATIRRLESERDSLLKQLQKEVFKAVKTGLTPKKQDPVHNVRIEGFDPDSERVSPGGVSATGPLTPRRRGLSSTNTSTSEPVGSAAAVLSPQRTAAPLYADPCRQHAAATPATQEAPAPKERPHNHHHGSKAAAATYEGQGGGRKTYNQILNEQNRRNLGPHNNNNTNNNNAKTHRVSMPHGPQNKNIFVCCPACTYEQKYGNVRCELCNTELVFAP